MPAGPSSKMTSRYVHFSARDLEDAVLELYGLKTTTKDTGIAKLFDCQDVAIKILQVKYVVLAVV
ncbi:MAG: hypothetical protein FWC14_06615 [Candidatus Bathyarchaeota archaeon]|uniref:hypothetical protein n=1 Tax=Candidatus Bathycorpusculum sp. TaxID=2994959 RepID=UPI0028246C8F|nr:hypothetical protein [Candidatus Termiticorpusculum sp.]